MTVTKEQQEFFMSHALTLGEKGRQSAPPNPWTGSVVVQNGQIVGAGAHMMAGHSHAEIVALKAAGQRAKGATLYVTLEPCSHMGRTPPCVCSIIESGIKKVVIPFLDPDPRVNGRGVEILRKSGIEVVMGVGEKEAKKSLAPYLFQRKTGKAFAVLKTACSIDGKVAAMDGSSQWITGQKARENVHLLRAESQAILIGTRTAVMDKPKLTVRHIPAKKQPLRVVLDCSGKIPLDSPLFDTSEAKTLVIASKETGDQRLKELEQRGVFWEIVDLKEGQVALGEILSLLGQKEILQVLVEGGPTLQSSFIEQKQANRLIVYTGSCLLGQRGKSLFTFPGPKSIQEAPFLTLESVQVFDQDVRLDYNCTFLHDDP